MSAKPKSKTRSTAKPKLKNHSNSEGKKTSLRENENDRQNPLSGQSKKGIEPALKTTSRVTPMMEPAQYAEFDGEWRRIGLASPARRALVDAKLYRVSDLRKISVNDLEELHGMGKSAIARLKVVMEAKKIKFRS